MANRVLRRVQRLRRIRFVQIAAVAVAVGAACAPIVASANPAPRPTDPTDVAGLERALGQLALQNTQLVEQYNQARLDLAARTKASAAASAAARAADTHYVTAQAQYASTVVALYQGTTSFSATGALLSSESGDGYMQSLQSLSMVSDQAALVLQNLTDAKVKADTLRARAGKLLADTQAKSKALNQQRGQTQAKIDKYTQLLARLNGQQRAAYLRAQFQPVSAVTVTQEVAAFAPTAPAAGVSAAVRTVISFALAQVGKPYVWGAAGPYSYDCSGLTMQAFARAGISLPHSAAGQYEYGRHVSASDLRPGDLVFFYSPIGHVALYIGNGLIVHAPTSGQDVTVRPLSGMMAGMVGATRLIG